jgi:hypothetical protein
MGGQTETHPTAHHGRHSRNFRRGESPCGEVNHNGPGKLRNPKIPETGVSVVHYLPADTLREGQASLVGGGSGIRISDRNAQLTRTLTGFLRWSSGRVTRRDGGCAQEPSLTVGGSFAPRPRAVEVAGRGFQPPAVSDRRCLADRTSLTEAWRILAHRAWESTCHWRAVGIDERFSRIGAQPGANGDCRASATLAAGWSLAYA